MTILGFSVIVVLPVIALLMGWGGIWLNDRTARLDDLDEERARKASGAQPSA